jgi:NADPH:quinone reductase-like Zn-dependent oxidoreductase
MSSSEVEPFDSWNISDLRRFGFIKEVSILQDNLQSNFSKLKMQAIKIQAIGKAAVTKAAIPTLRPGYILVKTRAVALNPTDWKHIGFVSDPVTVGCDYSGVVEKVGEDVSLPWKAGDRVCGVVHGASEAHPEDGAFGEYLIAKGDLQIKVPESLTDEEAAALGMGVGTVGQGMYQALNLPWPDKPATEKFPIFIYGGSSAMGAYGIQFAKA